MSEVTSKTEEKTTTTAKAPIKTTTTPTKKATKEVVIYVGPEIAEVVAANTIFNNGISNELENAIEKVPAIKKLIIPIKELSVARIQINTKDSALAICYKKVCEYAKEKKGV